MNIPVRMQSFRGNQYQGLCKPGLPSRLACLLEDPQQAERISGVRRILCGPLRTIWKVPADDESSYFVHLFQYQRRRLVPRIKRMHELLHALQVPTFEMVALGQGIGRNRRREFFITRAIADAVTLPADLGHRYEVVPETLELPEKLANSLAHFVSDLHRKAVVHGDLKSRHILLQKKNGEQKFYLVDLEKSHSLRLMPGILVDLLRVRDLIQLSASCSHLITNQHKVRFLRNYLRRLAIGAFRRRTFYFVLRLYSDHNFCQGRTLLQNLIAALL